MEASFLTTQRFKIVLAVVVVATALLTVWWMNSSGDEPIYGSFSAPSYGSVEELTANSDLVVEGVVDGVAGRELDFGTANLDEREGESGVPFVYYEVKVVDTLKGTSGDMIIVGNVDGEELISEEVTPLKAGDKVLLFLMEQNREKDSPGLTQFDFYYTPLSLNAGVFDVLSDGSVKPRAPERILSIDPVLTRNDIEDLIARQ